jgi:nucleoside-diphosphate-sugar epimerase
MCASDILETARLVRASLAAEVPIEVASSPKSAPANRYVPDTSRSVEELGLQQYINLREGVRRTAAWHRLAPCIGPASQSLQPAVSK